MHFGQMRPPCAGATKEERPGDSATRGKSDHQEVGLEKKGAFENSFRGKRWSGRRFGRKVSRWLVQEQAPGQL